MSKVSDQYNNRHYASVSKTETTDLDYDAFLERPRAQIQAWAAARPYSTSSQASHLLYNEAGIHWRVPSFMIATCVTGIAVAVGHHLYYSSLDGRIVVDLTSVDSKWSLDAVRNSQEWKIRFGTIFAFSVQTLLSSAVSTAYEQEVWALVRRATVSIKGLDALFSATFSFWSLCNFELWLKAQLGALIALLRW